MSSLKNVYTVIEFVERYTKMNIKKIVCAEMK